ncbi:MAG: HesB/IscA family protein [Gammaproteobacteria bacterium]
MSASAEHIAASTGAQNIFKDLLTDEISITDSAHEQLKALVDGEDEVEAVRIFVMGGGCSGMTYSMTFATEKFEHDAVFEKNGLNVYVDAVALSYLKGVEIDYIQQPTGASFIFNNVFQSVGGAGTCGTCGSAGGGCA